MRDHLNALVLAVLATSLDSGLVPLNTQILQDAVKCLVLANRPNYTLAAELHRITYTAIERNFGPCQATILLRCARGEQLEAAGASGEAIDAYKALAIECRNVLRTQQPIDGGLVTSWMNAGVACRRHGQEREAERCYEEEAHALDGSEPEKVRNILHMNRFHLYERCSLPGRHIKVKAALCNLMGMPLRRSSDIVAACTKGNSVAMKLAGGEEWVYAMGDLRPRRTQGTIEGWRPGDPVGRQARDDAASANEVKRQVQQHVGRLAGVRVLNPCDGCGERHPVEEQRRCGECLLVSYCSVECQRDHWKAHKPECRAAAARRAEAQAAASSAASAGGG
jgi:hypothetical protein